MDQNNCEILKDILSELEKEYIYTQKTLERNQLKYQEIDLLLKSMFELEDNDFKVFSPRNIETTHKDKISQLKEILSSYEKENEELSILSDNLLKKINSLKMIIKNEEDYIVKFFNIQEEERHRISRELHDTSLQNLAYLVHKIELSSMYIDQDPIRAKLELSVVNKNLKSTIEDIRNTIYNLRPMEFDDLGIQAAFEKLIYSINIDKIYDIDFSVDDVSCENNFTLLTLYRAVQECLINIKKHAEATKIIFHAKYNDNKYHIRIEDNGKGFTKQEVEEKKNCHFGLSLVRERIHILNGTFNIVSSDKGTKIEIEIPTENLIIR